MNITAALAAVGSLLASQAPLEALIRWDLDMRAMGWAQTAQAPGTVMFARRAADAGSFRRIWARYEYLDHRSSRYGRYRSETQLHEVDCGQSRNRILQTFHYAEQNLSGPVTDSASSAWPKWTHAQPDTFSAALVRVVCGAPQTEPGA